MTLSIILVVSIQSKKALTNELQQIYAGSIETGMNNISGESVVNSNDPKANNDFMIAKIWQDNQFDLKNLTKGNIKPNEFITKKNDANGENNDDIMEGNQYKNDINNNNEGFTIQ